jgi:hypothetical protein
MIPSILKLLSAGEEIMLEANDGKSKIYGNNKTFKTFISENFKNYGLNENSRATTETLADIYEIVKDAKFAEIFTSLNCGLDKLVMTQSQIVRFCEKHSNWVHQEGCNTFFLIKKDENLPTTDGNLDNLFVVSVGVYAVGLRVHVDRFGRDCVWLAGSRLRVVLPQLIPQEQ